MAAGIDIEEMVQMHGLKRRLVVGLTLIVAFAFSGMALAASDGEDDTVFNYGYDETSQFFMWNVTSLDWEPDAALLAELIDDDPSLSGDDFALLLAACGLGPVDDMDATEYGYVFDGETISLYALTDGSFDPDDDPVDTGSCGAFEGGYVTGPSGQVNHGMFLKLFNSVYDGPNKGCVVSHVARSGLGKEGEQKVQASPDYEAPDAVEEIEDGRITFTTVGADCQKGPDGDADALEEEGGRGGPPQHVLDKHADKWDGDGPGKSGSAAKGRP